MSQKITIDGREFEFDDMNETARIQLGNLRAADQRIAQLKTDLAMAQTARNVYAKMLGDNLPKDDIQTSADEQAAEA